MIKLLIDENAPRSVVETLKKYKFDLLWIREHHRGMKDEEIIQLSLSQDRIVLTFDKDFGELTYRLKMNAPGIILVRITNNKICEEKVLKLLKAYGDSLKGYFTVLTETKIRRRKIGW